MTAELKALGALAYAALRERVEEGPSLLGVTFLTRGEWEVKEVEAPSGRVYNVEINVVWDDKPQGPCA